MKLLAPNGKPSNLTPEQYKLVRTPEFKAWFGDWENDSKNASKVVDENGEPLVVYHGTNYKWRDEQGNVVPEMRGFGLHLGTLKAATDRVKSFTMNINPHIKELFVNARNILHLSRDYRFHDSLTKVSTELYKDGIISKEEKNKFIRVYSDEATFDNLRKLLIEKYGFNGITYRNNIEDRGSLSYIIFNPNQIKLADGTNTTFDSNNPDIRFEKGGYIRAIKKIYKDGDEYVYGGKFGLKGTINWKYNPKNNYLYLMGIERNTDKSVGEGTKAINYLFELYPKINKIIFEIDNDEDKNIWKFYDKIGATEEGGGKLNINSFFAELKREDKRFSNGGDVFYINSSEYADGGELTLTSEQVENKLGRKLHWWNDDVVTIQGSQYKKVFLKSEYRKI